MAHGVHRITIGSECNSQAREIITQCVQLTQLAAGKKTNRPSCRKFELYSKR